MAIGDADVEKLTASDIEALVANKVPESRQLEFKRDIYGKSDGDKREFLKDVSALANAIGGTIVIGIEEVNGVASRLCAIPFGVADSEIQRMENLVRDGLEPRIVTVQMRSITVDGGVVIVLRVPDSWNKPHRVIAGNANRFWIRNSSGAHEADWGELRDLFMASAGLNEKMTEFRQQRLNIIYPSIVPTNGEGPGALVIHILPVASFRNQSEVDPRKAHPIGIQFAPDMMRTSGARYNFDGVQVVGEWTKGKYRTEIFRSGRVEMILMNIVSVRDERRIMPSLALERLVIRSIAKILEGMRSLEVAPPFVAMVTLIGVKNATLGVKDDWTGQGQVISESLLMLPDVLIDRQNTEGETAKLLRPAIDVIWNAAGHAQSENYAADGGWTGG